LEGEDKVTVFFCSAQKGISSNFISKPADRTILDFVLRGAADLFQPVRFLPLKRDLNPAFSSAVGFGSGRKAGGKPSPFFLSLPVMITESWDHEEADQ